ncbi:FTR1 family iron permease [Agitococcus lubricus]|uniref:High-affinity iron transporter n=1 Tax=Agitococcus lubricus TaxID=1077255 RepID=A0A2T5ITJ0_9GAMM|nr:FTR1 family protein [Agitococcus lubricus]PTQ87163.1 high-affinity iron transporter [Agitococcus lubricus]
MLAIFMTTFREGLEALLVISVAMAFLRQTGNSLLLRPLLAGSLIAISGSAVLGIYLAHTGALSPVWEGWLALVAAALIITCVIHMVMHGKKMAYEIRERLNILTQGKVNAVWWSVLLFAVLMVGREGVEAATLIAALASTASGLTLTASAIGGLSSAAVLAWLWGRYGQRVNVGLLFRVTGTFLALFSVQLVVYAFHEFAEAGALPLLDNGYWHELTEPYGPGGEYGVWLTYTLILAPLSLIIWDKLSSHLWTEAKA